MNMEQVSRILGEYRGEGQSGPTFIIMTAIHGNEPAGPHAAARVLRKLEKGNYHFHGRLIVLLGNIPAYLSNQRYIDQDFNRMWDVDEIGRQNGQVLNSEQQQFVELRETFDQIVDQARERGDEIFLIDLHTSSGHTVPFGGTTGHEKCVAFSKQFPIPFSVGLEKNLPGLFYVYAANKGIATVVIEGGQHEAPGSVDNHEAAIWTGLLAAECVSVKANPELGEYYRLLRVQSGNVPKTFEIFYQHDITDEDQFKMLPNFSTFQAVSKGQVLAHDRNGEIRAPEDCMILLPLYQPRGSDGFFLIRAVAPVEK